MKNTIVVIGKGPGLGFRCSKEIGKEGYFESLRKTQVDSGELSIISLENIKSNKN